MRDADARIWCRSLGNYSIAPPEGIPAVRIDRPETMLREEVLTTESNRARSSFRSYDEQTNGEGEYAKAKSLIAAFAGTTSKRREQRHRISAFGE